MIHNVGYRRTHQKSSKLGKIRLSFKLLKSTACRKMRLMEGNAKCRHIKKFTCKETLRRQVFIKDYRLEIQSLFIFQLIFQMPTFCFGVYIVNQFMLQSNPSSWRDGKSYCDLFAFWAKIMLTRPNVNNFFTDCINRSKHKRFTGILILLFN